jgi:hypothetical protein
MGQYKKQQVMAIVYPNSAYAKGMELYCIVTLGYIPENAGMVDRFSARRMSRKDRPIE